MSASRHDQGIQQHFLDGVWRPIPVSVLAKTKGVEEGEDRWDIVCGRVVQSCVFRGTTAWWEYPVFRLLDRIARWADLPRPSPVCVYVSIVNGEVVRGPLGPWETRDEAREAVEARLVEMGLVRG